MTQEHTALPYGIKHEVNYTLIHRAGEIVAEIWRAKEGVPKANAEFIVQACNSHYELLEACQLLLGTVDDFMPNIGRCVLQNYHQLNQGLIKGRAAIAKATEKP